MIDMTLAKKLKKQYSEQYSVILLQYLFHRFMRNVIFANIFLSNL